MKTVLFMLMATTALLSCSHEKKVTNKPEPKKIAKSEPQPVAKQVAKVGPKIEKTTLEKVGLDKNAMDQKVNPCDDFYQYACGGWIKSSKIPADRTKWSRSFSEINKSNLEYLKKELANASTSKDPEILRLGKFYASCTDLKAIEKEKTTNIKPILKKISKIRSKKQFLKQLAELHKLGVWAFFDIEAGQDYKNANNMIAIFDQNGLTLPDRDFYLKKGARFDNIRKNLHDYIVKMLEFTGEKSRYAKRYAKKIIALETKIAEYSKSKVERRNPAGMYNKVTISDLERIAPKFKWKSYFKNMKISTKGHFNITSKPFFDKISLLIDKENIKTLKYYLKWHLINTMAPYLSKKFVDAKFDMRKVLTGQDKQMPRWKKCIGTIDWAMGEILGKSFVKAKFNGNSKAKAKLYVTTISKMMANLLNTLTWMDKKTKAKAYEKLQKVAYLIGFPEKWKTYNFSIGKSFMSNVISARRFRIARDLAKIGKPVDKKEWFMTPQTVNAYYSPHRNHMVFPAGILQPPFFNPKASVAVNLGGMGMVVGHELTHGFDDQGSQFDGDGNLNNWWSKTVRNLFNNNTSCMVNQYGNYEVRKGFHLNGKLTLGENIADNGGIKLAFAAYRKLRSKAKTVKVADGFNEDQQFFLSYAQIWCSKYRDKYAELSVKVDPHSHPKFRVNGALSNFPQFAKAFKCKSGTKLAPKNRCNVW